MAQTISESVHTAEDVKGATWATRDIHCLPRLFNARQKGSAAAGSPIFQSTKVATTSRTTLADLLAPLLVANPFSAVRASLRRWSSEEFEDGLAYGGQCRLRRRSGDSFFSAVLL